MKIYLAADHRGFKLKEAVKRFLVGRGYDVKDLGALGYDAGDDYPDFAFPAAMEVSKAPEERRGIFFCGSGIGMDIAANKVRGVRATVACSVEAARHARANDEVNIISIAGDAASPAEAEAIAAAFLETPFGAEERHMRRLNKIEEIEERNFK